MIRQSVISTDLRSIGYDEVSAVLEIEFQQGGIYHYLGVPESVYTALMSAPSKGRYFNANIKKSYQCQKIG